MPFEMLETETSGTVIKVIGVGGAGGNAVEHMIRRDVQNVEFIVANTDRQALKRSSSSNLLQLGKTGLGAGAKPEVGRQAEQAEKVEGLLGRDGVGVEKNAVGAPNLIGEHAGLFLDELLAGVAFQIDELADDLGESFEDLFFRFSQGGLVGDLE